MTKDFNWRIPEYIDLPKLIMDSPPNFKLKPDHCYSIIDTICERSLFLDLDETEYVNLHSDILQYLNHNYKKYIDYLIDNYIIESDEKYTIGKKSFGYKINEDYISDFIEIPIKTFTLKKRIKKVIEKEAKEDEKTTAGYEYLTKWFNDKLCIDKKEAINKIKERKMANKKGGAQGLLRQDKEKISRNLLAVEKFANKEFACMVDPNIGRFHSRLTNLKKEMRNYITYDGKPLVNLDINNSQPLLSGVLLNKAFYKEGEGFNIYYIPSVIKLFKSNKILNDTLSQLYISIMSVEPAEMPVCKGFAEYLNLIQKGTFYQELSTLLFPKDPFDKEEIKKVVYTIFFSDNRGKNRNKKIFEKHFPEVYSIFKLIKRRNKRILSHLLQRIESYIIIETVAKRIGIEQPQLPIFTIHDSIACPIEHMGYVETLMKEEILNITGLSAEIGKEYWTPEKSTKE